MLPVDKYTISISLARVKCIVRQVCIVEDGGAQCNYIVNILISLDKTI